MNARTPSRIARIWRCGPDFMRQYVDVKLRHAYMATTCSKQAWLVPFQEHILGSSASDILHDSESWKTSLLFMDGLLKTIRHAEKMTDTWTWLTPRIGNIKQCYQREIVAISWHHNLGSFVWWMMRLNWPERVFLWMQSRCDSNWLSTSHDGSIHVKFRTFPLLILFAGGVDKRYGLMSFVLSGPFRWSTTRIRQD